MKIKLWTQGHSAINIILRNSYHSSTPGWKLKYLMLPYQLGLFGRLHLDFSNYCEHLKMWFKEKNVVGQDSVIFIFKHIYKAH